MSVYGATRVVFRFLLYGLYRMKVQGRENMPEGGSFIILSNHRSMIDPFVLGTLYEDGELHFMAKEELFHNPIVRWYITRMHGFPVKRGQADLSAMRTAMQVLRDGDALGIFPEGTRHKDGVMGQVQSGVSVLTLRSNVPLVPVYLSGKYRIGGKPRAIIGKPIETEDLRARRPDKETLDELDERIYSALLALQREAGRAK